MGGFPIASSRSARCRPPQRVIRYPELGPNAGERPMRRREVITLFGGAAAAWPLAARAQQPAMKRIGVLLPAVADDAVWQARLGAFLQALALLGWTIDRNVRIDTRWGTTNAAELRRHAAELAAL